MKKHLGLMLAALVAAGCGGETADTAGEKLVWTAIPDADAELLRQKYDPISAYLTEKLGVTVEYRPVAKYKASVDGFKSGDIQLAWFGGLTGVQARAAVPGANAIAQGAEDPQYKSYFIAHVSTGIEPSEEFPAAIADVPFTFGSESSTSGRLMPEFFIRQMTGKAPSDFFKKGISFSGAHDLTAKQVAEGGKIKAGVLSYTTYDKMVSKGEIDPDVCRIVWTTPFYADYNFTAHPRLEEMFGAGFTDKLQRALIDMKDPKLLDAFPRSALIEAKNEDFEGIEKTAVELGLLRG